MTGGELFEDIVAREFYSEADARYVTMETVATDTVSALTVSLLDNTKIYMYINIMRIESDIGV